MKLDRMELADCGTPEALVTAILKQVPDMPLPVPIDDICRQLDIREIRVVDSDGFEGGLIAFADKSEGTILINRNSNPQRRRFTAGHELCHFLSPWHKPRGDDGFRCTSRDMRLTIPDPMNRAVQMEVEANRFAAGILFPPPLFRRDMAARRSVDVEHVLDLATRYDMSKDATARRYVEAHGEPCAAVVSRHGKFLRSYRHKEFPFIHLESGRPLPRATATARLSLEEGKSSDWVATDGTEWINDRSARRGRKVFEQVLAQQNGFRLTLLTLDDEDGDADDDRDIESSWQARFPGRRR